MSLLGSLRRVVPSTPVLYVVTKLHPNSTYCSGMFLTGPSAGRRFSYWSMDIVASDEELCKGVSDD